MPEQETAVQPSEPSIAAISNHWLEFCTRAELSVFTTAAEKHGSLVWEAGKVLAGLDRYLMFSLTALDLGDIVFIDEYFPQGVRSAGWGHVPASEKLVLAGPRVIAAGHGFISVSGELVSAITAAPVLRSWQSARASVTTVVQSDSARTTQLHESWGYDTEADILADIHSSRLRKSWFSAWQWAQQLSERNLTDRFEPLAREG